MTSLSIVQCPTCHQSVVWSPQNLYRPFCCQRCQLIDLGEWASEKKVMVGPDLTHAPESITDCD